MASLIEDASRISAWITTKVKEAGAKGVVVGLSGGIDSSLVAVLSRRAMEQAESGERIAVLKKYDFGTWRLIGPDQINDNQVYRALIEVFNYIREQANAELALLHAAWAGMDKTHRQDNG